MDDDAPTGNAALVELGAHPLAGDWDAETLTVDDLLAMVASKTAAAREAEEPPSYEQMSLLDDGD